MHEKRNVCFNECRNYSSSFVIRRHEKQIQDLICRVTRLLVLIDVIEFLERTKNCENPEAKLRSRRCGKKLMCYQKFVFLLHIFCLLYNVIVTTKTYYGQITYNYSKWNGMCGAHRSGRSYIPILCVCNPANVWSNVVKVFDKSPPLNPDPGYPLSIQLVCKRASTISAPIMIHFR